MPTKKEGGELMKKSLKNFLIIALIFLVLMFILPTNIWFTLIWLFILYLLISSYIRNIIKYKKGEKLPGYINLILILTASVMSDSKGFHTHYTTVSTAVGATNSLEDKKQSKIPIVIYTFVTIALISFVVFVCLISNEIQSFSTILLCISFLSIVLALLILFINYICTIIKKMSKKDAIMKIVVVGIMILVFIILAIIF